MKRIKGMKETNKRAKIFRTEQELNKSTTKAVQPDTSKNKMLSFAEERTRMTKEKSENSKDESRKSIQEIYFPEAGHYTNLEILL